MGAVKGGRGSEGAVKGVRVRGAVKRWRVRVVEEVWGRGVSVMSSDLCESGEHGGDTAEQFAPLFYAQDISVSVCGGEINK